MRKIYPFICFVLFCTILEAQVSISNARVQGVGSTVTVRGIVTTNDEFGSVLRYIQDGTGGLALYSSSVSSLKAGDSVEVTGTLKEYNNLLEMDPVTSVNVISSGNSLPAPQVLSLSDAFSENYEGQLVQVNNVEFIQSGNFVTPGSGDNFKITDGNSTEEVRIYTASDISGTPIPSGKISIVGVMGQFYSTYQLQPRSLDDIGEPGPQFLTALQQENISSTGFEVSFKTATDGSTIISYGTSPAMGQYVYDGVFTTDHNINITGLSPATVYYVQGMSINASADTSFSAIEVMATQSNSSGNIRVYFNQPVDQSKSSGTPAVYLNNTFDDTIIALISRAKETIDLAIYNFDDENGIVTALNNAYANGVDVRVVMDKGVSTTRFNSLNMPASMKRKSPNGKNPNGNYYGLMHNKFLIIDAESSDPNRPLVISGSTNFTDNQLMDDPNNLVIIQDQTLAKAYKLEFEEMLYGSFGEMKTQNTPRLFNIGGNHVELVFGPTGGGEEKVSNAIAQANYDLYVALFSWTRYGLAYDIRDRMDAGVFAAALWEDTSAQNAGTGYNILYNEAPGQMIIEKKAELLHHKYMIVDPNKPSSDPFVLTGSANWSSNGFSRSDENFLIIHSEDIANQYYQEWSRRYQDNGGTIFVNVGIEEIAETSGFQVYPNPAQDILYFSKPLQNTSVNIYNLQGQLIETNLINENLISTSNLKNGIYLLEINSPAGRSIHRVIIQR